MVGCRSLLVALSHQVMSSSASPSAVIHDSLSDERWQLVQRILASPPFQKSGRLRDLLQYITEQTIRGCAHELTEQHIGEAVFHKATGYSPLEDSSVRVHARQLRLKLHEYFDGVGRDEPLVVEIPKGTYAPVFRVARRVESGRVPVVAPIGPITPGLNQTAASWMLCGVLALLWTRHCLLGPLVRSLIPATRQLLSLRMAIMACYESSRANVARLRST